MAHVARLTRNNAAQSKEICLLYSTDTMTHCIRACKQQ